MTYNPRIRNKRSSLIQITGSVMSVTGAIRSSTNITATSTVSGSVGTFTNVTASVISASQYLGPIGGGSGDVTTAGNNTFTGINTFNIVYITASAGITGSDAKFTTITGTLNGLSTAVAVLSSNTTLTSNNHVALGSASTVDIIITLPSASASPFRHYIIKKIDPTAFKIVVSGSGGQTIDGNDNRQIGTQYETLTIVNDGINKWFIL